MNKDRFYYYLDVIPQMLLVVSGWLAAKDLIALAVIILALGLTWQNETHPYIRNKRQPHE